MRLTVRALAALLVWATLPQAGLYAETGHDAWLRYAALAPAARARTAADLPTALTVFETAPSILRARDEIVRGLHGMLASDLRVSAAVPGGGSITMGVDPQGVMFALHETPGTATAPKPRPRANAKAGRRTKATAAKKKSAPKQKKNAAKKRSKPKRKAGSKK